MRGIKYTVLIRTYSGSTVYGLKIQSASDYIREYPFVSMDESEVYSLIRQMQAGDISPVHFDDIVTDYLRLLYHKKLLYNGLEH